MDSSIRKKILVVDDDDNICNCFKDFLDGEEFEVTMCSDPKQALELLRNDSNEKFDLLIVDLMMPGYNGFEVIKMIQEWGYQHVPVFVVTARSLDKGLEEIICREANVQKYLTKPIDLIAIRENILTLLG